LAIVPGKDWCFPAIEYSPEIIDLFLSYFPLSFTHRHCFSLKKMSPSTNVSSIFFWLTIYLGIYCTKDSSADTSSAPPASHPVPGIPAVPAVALPLAAGPPGPPKSLSGSDTAGNPAGIKDQQNLADVMDKVFQHNSKVNSCSLMFSLLFLLLFWVCVASEEEQSCT
jgi:hypothetical protein